MSSEYLFEDYMARATEALEDGNADTAMDWVNQALSVSKHLEQDAIAKALYLKSQVLIAQEEYAAAEETLQKSLDLFHRSVDTHLLLGELMLLDGRDESAASAFESVLEISPQNAAARCLLIFCCAQLSRYDLATRLFDQCVELAPELEDSYHHMGISVFRQSTPEAREFFEKALSKNPVLSGPHHYLGLIEMAESDVAAAQEQFRKELELNPANSLAELQLIRAHLLSVPWQEAVELFDKHVHPDSFCDIPVLRRCHFHFNYEVLEEEFRSFMRAVQAELPQTPQNLFRVARIYRHKSLPGEAAEHLRKVMEADKSFRPAYEELAEVYRMQDELGRACDVLEQAAAQFGDAESYCALGRGFLLCGRYNDAQDSVKKAVSLGPELAEPHFLLGVILADRASRTREAAPLMKEARASLEKALEGAPDHAAARAYLMEVAFREGEYEECLELAERALRENPDSQRALSYSGRCLQALGSVAGAEERLLKVAELYPDDSAARASLAELYVSQDRFADAAEQLELAITIPGRRPQPKLLLRLGELYLTSLSQPQKAREYLVRFLQAAPPGHPDFDRAKELLGGI